MQKITLFFCLCAATLAWGQNQEKTLTETYGETIMARDFRAHIEFLASDLMEGRETGERGQRMAAAYIRSQFQRLGLKPGNPTDQSYYQYYYFNRSKVKDGMIKLGRKSYQFGEDFFNYRSALPNSLKGEWVFGGFGLSLEDYNNLAGLEVKDKIVFIFSGHPNNEEMDRWSKIKNWQARKDKLEALGAKAMVMILPESMEKTMKRYASRQSMTISGLPEPGMPAIYLTAAMGTDLLGRIKVKEDKLMAQLMESPVPPQLKFDKLDFELTATSDFSSTPASNVVGFLEGTDKKDEVIVLTGHYDHIGIKNGEVNNGADDDASGTSAILEMAEAFVMAAAEGNGPRRSILFMTVSGEEKGLLGSAFYADHPLYPLENTVANLNIDMIGRIDEKYASSADSTNYVYIIGSDKLSTELHEINEAMNQEYTNLVLDYTYNDDKDPNRFYYRSDHYNFAQKGIPIIFYFTGVHEDYHRPTDDPHKIRYEKTAHIARLIFATAWELANRENRIVADKLER